MKKVEALIPAHQLDAVVDALRTCGLEEIVISEVLQSSRGRGRLYRGVKYAVDFAAEIKLEAVVGDELALSTVHSIAEVLRSTPAATAGIFVTPVEAVIEISGHRQEPAAAWNAGTRPGSVWAPNLGEARSGV